MPLSTVALDEDHVHDPWLGRELDGRYRIERRLGMGGFGVVYRATQTAVARPVAVKILHARHACSPEHMVRFRREAQALGRIRHSGLVQIFDFGQVAGGGPLFIVMELLEGETLATRLQRTGAFAPEAVITIGLAVLEVLAEAHAQGIVHLDLKPANLFLVQQGRREVVKVLDFGIAEFLGDDEQGAAAGAAFGSPRYRSPEQALGMDSSARTDLYSLGVVLHELLAARPGSGATPPAGRLTQTLRRFMAHDPAERPRDAAHAAALLEACREEPNDIARERERRPASMGDEMARRRESAFVGRHPEQQLFEELVQGDGELRIVNFHGPGGIGKTTLLSACCDWARARGLEVLWLDAAELVSSPQLLHVALAPVLAAPPDLLVIDRLEQAWGLLESLRVGVLPRLPSSTRVILGSRRRLGWELHAGLGGMVEEHEVSSLSRGEGWALLGRRGVAQELRATIHEEAQGHPLTLALLADVLRDSPRAPGAIESLFATPSLLQRLAQRLVEQVPTDDHRRGLVAASMSMRCTEDDLRAIIPADRIAEVFQWLAELSCMRMSGGALSAHDLMRRVIAGEARYRSPELVRELRELLGRRALSQLRDAGPDELRSRIVDMGYICAQMAEIPYHPIDIDAVPDLLPARDEHWPAIEAMLERFEGPCAVEALRAWRGPHCETMVVCEGSEVLGFAAGLRLDGAPRQLLDVDPGTAALHRHMYEDRHFSSEGALIYFRFWAGSNHHMPSRAQTQIFFHMLELAMMLPGAVAVVSAHHPPAFWRRLHESSAHDMFEAAAFSLDGRDFLPFGKDFTSLSRSAWVYEHFARILAMPHAAPHVGVDGTIHALAAGGE